MSDTLTENKRVLDWYSTPETVVEPVAENTPEPEIIEGAVEGAIEATAVETPVVTEAATEPVVEPTPDETPKKVAVDLSEFVSTNKDSLKKYFEINDLDVTKLTNQEAVTLKLKSEHPYYTDEDIADELKVKYGIGKKLIEIDEETMSSDEIDRIREKNEKISEDMRIGERALKADSKAAVDFVQNLKDSTVLPTWEYEASSEQAATSINNNSPEEVLEQHFKVQAEQLEKARAEYWIPTVKSSLSEISTISETVEYEVNGSKVALDINYTLNDADKSEVETWLSDITISDAEAAQYAKPDGTYDIKSFVQHKSEERLSKKLMSVLAKEVAAKTLSEFVQNNLVNHVPSAVSGKAPHEDDRSSATIFDRMKKIKN